MEGTNQLEVELRLQDQGVSGPSKKSPSLSDNPVLATIKIHGNNRRNRGFGGNESGDRAGGGYLGGYSVLRLGW